MYEGSVSIQYDYYCGLSQLMSCASAPSILGLNHLLEGKKASCYPEFEEDLLEAKISYTLFSLPTVTQIVSTSNSFTNLY